MRREKLRRIVVVTCFLNFLVAYILYQFAFGLFVPNKVAQMDDTVRETINTAESAEKRFYNLKGRYYSVGPVKGPYSDENGLKVEKDVILQVEPEWDKNAARETFKAYAMHAWGNNLLIFDELGKIVKPDKKSPEAARIKSKLMNSVK